MTEISEMSQLMRGLSEDARFEAWMAIYSAMDDEANQKIREVLQGEDPWLKIGFVRFLSRMPEERAVDYLVGLLEDPNSVVFEAVVKAIEKNGYSNKWSRLNPMIGSRRAPAQFYAIEKLSQANCLDALPPLLSMLSSAREKLLIQVLKALRYYSDERIFPYVRPYLSDPSEEVRFRAVLAVGSLYEGESREARRPFLEALGDPSPKVRTAVLWGLRRRPLKRDLKAVFSSAQADPDPGVRREAVANFAFFPTTRVVRFLLGVLTSEKSKDVLLKAEGVLNGFPKDHLARLLWRIIRKERGAVRDRALLIMAEMKRPQASFCRFVVSEVRSTRDPKRLVALLEALGFMEDASRVGLLESHLKGNPLLAYTAMGSLLKIWSQNPSDVPIDRYLLDDDLTPLLKQTILKKMIKAARWEVYEEKFQGILNDFLKHENLNIRYLAAQVLAPIATQSVLERCFKSFLEETDAAYSQFLKESIQKQIVSHPEWIGPLVVQNMDKAGAVPSLFAILEEAPLFGAVASKLISALLNPPVSVHLSAYHESFRNFLTLLLLEKKMQISSLSESIEQIPGRGSILEVLAAILVRHPEIEGALPVDRLKAWFWEEGASTREAIVLLLALSQDERAIGFLSTLAFGGSAVEAQKGALLGLKHLMTGMVP